MDHQDHVNLLRRGVPPTGGMWADLGSGHGAFTLALAECLSSQGEIYSVDRDGKALESQRLAMQARFPTVLVHYLSADFTRPLPLPLLNGLVMANALHFIADKGPTLRLIRGYLRPHGRLVVVEYNVDRGNPWVPYPFSFRKWEQLALAQGFTRPQLLSTRPSRFLGEIYAALCFPDENRQVPAG